MPILTFAFWYCKSIPTLQFFNFYFLFQRLSSFRTFHILRSLIFKFETSAIQKFCCMKFYLSSDLQTFGEPISYHRSLNLYITHPSSCGPMLRSPQQRIHIMPEILGNQAINRIISVSRYQAPISLPNSSQS